MLLRRNKVAKQMKRTDSFRGSIPLNPPVLYTYSSSSVSEEGLRGKKGVPLYKSRLYPKKAHCLPGKMFYGIFTEQVSLLF